MASKSASMASSDHERFTARITKALEMHSTKPNTFGQNIWDHLELVSVDVQAYDPEGKAIDEEQAKRLEAQPGAKRIRREARVVIEAVVREDWLNPVGTLHGAASAYLVDICTSLPIVALSSHDFWKGLGGMSQTLSLTYHAPAPPGMRIRVDSRSLNVGKMIANMRCEITDAQTGKLLVSGSHTKVDTFTRNKGKL